MKVKIYSLYFLIFLVSILLVGCARVEGLRDKSYTVRSLNSQIEGPIIILPIREVGSTPGLAEAVEDSLYKCLKSKLPQKEIIDAETFKTRLLARNLEMNYGQWKSTYDSSRIISVRPLGEFSKAVSARYFLLVPTLYIGRERIRGVDAGYSGWVADANNVWRTDLKILAEVLDTEQGKVIWKGVGYAENIHSPRKDLDLGLVIQHAKNPEIQAYIQPMIDKATEGVVNSMLGIGSTKNVKYSK